MIEARSSSRPLIVRLRNFVGDTVLSLPALLSGTEDDVITLAGLSVGDVDGDSLTLTIGAAGGSVSVATLTGKDLVIEAGAGTGKTSTLVHIAKANPEKRMQYVAFNSAIVRESKAKMPGTRTMGFLVCAWVLARAGRDAHRPRAASAGTSSFFMRCTCVFVFCCCSSAHSSGGGGHQTTGKPGSACKN